MRLFGGVLIACILIYASAGLATQQPQLSFTTIVVEGTKVVPPADIQATVRGTLADVRGLIFSAATIATYDKKAISDTLLFAIPRLKSVDSHAESVSTLTVTVTERTSVGQWCSATVCYLLDDTGYMFEKIATSSATGITYQNNVYGEPLRQMFLHGDFPHLYAFTNSLTTIGIHPTIIRIMEEGNAMEVESSGHPTIKALLDENLERTFSYLSTVLASQEFQTATQAGTIEYIDLRFNNRVYYK